MRSENRKLKMVVEGTESENEDQKTPALQNVLSGHGLYKLAISVLFGVDPRSTVVWLIKGLTPRISTESFSK